VSEFDCAFVCATVAVIEFDDVTVLVIEVDTQTEARPLAETVFITDDDIVIDAVPDSFATDPEAIVDGEAVDEGDAVIIVVADEDGDPEIENDGDSEEKEETLVTGVVVVMIDDDFCALPDFPAENEVLNEADPDINADTEEEPVAVDADEIVAEIEGDPVDEADDCNDNVACADDVELLVYDITADVDTELVADGLDELLGELVDVVDTVDVLDKDGKFTDGDGEAVDVDEREFSLDID
jgi:hypothetical protein